VPHDTIEETPTAITANLRNEPVQARSTARLTRLLDAAAEVIDEIGYERLTTAMVAERAGASIGTVYRYFPDRIALLQALSVRATADFIDEVNTVIADTSHASRDEAFDGVLDALEKAFSSQKGFRSIRFGDVIDLRPVESSNYAVVAGAVARSLAARFGSKAAEIERPVEVALLLADALLARALNADPAGDRQYIAAARSAARSHLAQELGAA